MSTPTQRGPTPDPLPQGVKTFVITAEALETITRQFLHSAAVGEEFGYDHELYLAEVGSLHACLEKVLRKDFGVSARITRATYRSDDLSLDVVEEQGFNFGMIFFPDRAHERHGVVPGEYSLHS